MLTTRRLLIPFLLLAAPVFSASSQSPTEPPRIPIIGRTYIGFNPLGLPADIATLEVESAVDQGITLGGVGSYLDVSDLRFTSFDFKVRYYPGEVVLRDWSVGGTVGFTRFSNVVNGSREALTAPTVGLVVDYNWLYGREQHFLIGTGLGAKRMIASSASRDRVDLPRAIFTLRMILGYAF